MMWKCYDEEDLDNRSEIRSTKYGLTIREMSEATGIPMPRIRTLISFRTYFVSPRRLVKRNGTGRWSQEYNLKDILRSMKQSYRYYEKHPSLLLPSGYVDKEFYLLQDLYNKIKSKKK